MKIKVTANECQRLTEQKHFRLQQQQAPATTTTADIRQTIFAAEREAGKFGAKKILQSYKTLVAFHLFFLL